VLNQFSRSISLSDYMSKQLIIIIVVQATSASVCLAACGGSVPESWTQSVSLGDYMYDIFLLQCVEYGFPHKASAIAFHPQLSLLALGTETGSLRMYLFSEEL